MHLSKVSFLWLFLATAMPSAQAADPGPLYQFDFADGTFANTGTVGGSAEENPVPGGPALVEVIKDATVGWEAIFDPYPNGAQGPSLLLPDSDGRLGLGNPEDALTISLWLKWNGPDKHPDVNQPIVWKPGNGPSPGWAFSVTETGVLRFDWKHANGGGSNRISEQTLTPGEWHHVGMIWKNDDKAGIEFYFDGEPVKPILGFTGGGPLECANEPIVVGANPRGHMPLNGSLRNLRLYDRALQPEEMSALAKDISH